MDFALPGGAGCVCVCVYVWIIEKAYVNQKLKSQSLVRFHIVFTAAAVLIYFGSFIDFQLYLLCKIGIGVTCCQEQDWVWSVWLNACWLVCRRHVSYWMLQHLLVLLRKGFEVTRSIFQCVQEIACEFSVIKCCRCELLSIPKTKCDNDFWDLR